MRARKSQQRFAGIPYLIGGVIFYKFGTVKEVLILKDVLPKEVYKTALSITTMLDKQYGADRDVDNNDRGFILIANNIQDVNFINEKYVRLDGGTHEAVDLVMDGRKRFINALFLSNNEFGINVFMSAEIAPKELLEIVPKRRT